ncbi:hypothetical protein KDD17_06925 [Sulfitobacter albidus]|uniref:Uncharacterized protein n=1 Tax=Sulfitobacter albidus TaxID=2829501 RepID=A0A975JGS9_9RHOB|nr:hypothetical protein [Sulfitobacter albidus]QUJ77685.1 hypothetical protein KDD17_06925 [Sulfitobacter albidus]
MSRRAIVTALAAITGLVHLLIGTFDTLYPALQDAAPLSARGGLMASWYLTGLFLLWSVHVFWHGQEGARQLGWVWIAGGMTFTVIALVEGGLPGLIALPQWIALCLTGGLALTLPRRR